MRRFFEPANAPAWLKAVLTSLRAALGDVWDVPVRPFRAATSAFPPAADHDGGLAYDETVERPAYSDGSSWIALAAYDADVAAIAALSTTGLIARTGAGMAAARTITGAANEIAVANGDGVSGNPTLSLPSALTFTGKTVTGGTYSAAVKATFAGGGFTVGAAAQIYGTAADGCVVAGQGTTTDLIVANENGSTIFQVATGTTTADFGGAITVAGNATLGNATSDSHTVNGKVAIEAANTTGGGDTTYPLRLASGGNSALTLGFDADEAFIQSWGSRTLRINQQGNTVALVSDVHVFSSGGYALSAGAISIAGNQVVAIRKTGWGGPTGTATRTTFDTTTVTTAQLAERVKALIDDLANHHGLIGA